MRDWPVVHCKRLKSLVVKLVNIFKIFPGYRGYRNREDLRETDMIIRNSLYLSLKDNVVTQMRAIFNLLLKNNDPNSSLVEQIILKSDMLAEKIRHAEQGYASLSSTYSVKEKELKKLISFDQDLAKYIADLIMRVNYLKYQLNMNNYSEVNFRLIEIDQIIDRLDVLFNARKNVIIKL